MTFTQLSHFTYGELSHFTYGELSLDIDALLDLIRTENRDIPVKTYETLLSLANKLNITIPNDISKHHTDFVRKRITLFLIVQILYYLALSSEFNIDLLPINFNITIQQINVLSDEELTDNCDTVQEVLNKLNE